MDFLRSSAEGRCNFVVRLLIFIMFEGVMGRFCATLCLPPARFLARRMPGAVVPSSEAELTKEEQQQHDPTLQWPCPQTVLPPEWNVPEKKSGKQPYFLNHVRGTVRCRQAAQRIGLAIGMVIQIAVMASLIDGQPMGTIGAHIVPTDVMKGVAVGTSLVALLFVSEVGLGWLRIVGFCEVVVPGERLLVNLLCDVAFHLGVSVQEELSLRGWMLVNTAQACAAHLGTSATTSMALAVAIQAALFAVLHLGSPGATRVGLMNLTVGGIAAALNVFVTGGLSFGLGWHFGWNLTMGHLLGMSTSGIPMSAKLVSVVPHPRKAKLHGGRFGPEQSPLAPTIYMLGCAALVALYGLDGMAVWGARILPGVVWS